MWPRSCAEGGCRLTMAPLNLRSGKSRVRRLLQPVWTRAVKFKLKFVSPAAVVGSQPAVGSKSPVVSRQDEFLKLQKVALCSSKLKVHFLHSLYIRFLSLRLCAPPAEKNSWPCDRRSLHCWKTALRLLCWLTKYWALVWWLPFLFFHLLTTCDHTRF